jgi:predicted N-acetyltransferase YhbS
MFEIIHQRPEDADKIPALLDKCFGANRHGKTAYRLREGSVSLPELDFVAYVENTMVGTIQYWPLLIESGHEALLLGPIAIDPDLQGKGIGVALIEQTLSLAAEFGHERVILVGDPEYYGKFGFVSASKLGLKLPGPVEKHRLLIKALKPDALDRVSGMVLKGRAPVVAPPLEMEI